MLHILERHTSRHQHRHVLQSKRANILNTHNRHKLPRTILQILPRQASHVDRRNFTTQTMARQKEQEAETQTGKEEKKPKNTQPAYIEAINRIYYLHESQKKTLRQIQQDETIMSLWKIIHGRDKPSIFAIREILIKPKPQETTQKEENL